MPKESTSWDRIPTNPSAPTSEEQILGSEANRMDADTHPRATEKTPPYGTQIPLEIQTSIRRTTKETATGGIPSLTIAEIAARERSQHASDKLQPPNAAILRRPRTK